MLDFCLAYSLIGFTDNILKEWGSISEFTLLISDITTTGPYLLVLTKCGMLRLLSRCV